MNELKKRCSGLLVSEDKSFRCKHGHDGPGMQACFGSRYPDGESLAPCEREDLPFDEIGLCVNRRKPEAQEGE